MCFAGYDKRTPSLSFHVAKNFWKCFGCDTSGDSIKLVMLARDCDFREAVNWLAEEFRIVLRSNSRTWQSRRQPREAHDSCRGKELRRRLWLCLQREGAEYGKKESADNRNS